jgi:plasmid stabilization system protein ParE
MRPITVLLLVGVLAARSPGFAQEEPAKKFSELNREASALDKLEERMHTLRQMPERGRVVPELATFGIHTHRELVVAPWRIIYRIGGRTVHVLAVLDGRRNVEDLLLDRLLK